MSEAQEPKTATEADLHSDLHADPHADRLSALLDGELDAAQTAAACAHWRADPQAQARWHSYSLIGDALRSEELTHLSSAREAAFLNGLRERLAHEPVPIGRAASLHGLAPADRSSPRSMRTGWTTPIGVAAGVLMVVGLAWTLRPGQGPSEHMAEVVAMATAPAAVLTNASTTVPATTPNPATEPADAELQPYLHAHRLVAGQSSAGLTPAVLRGVSHTPGAQ